MFPRKSRFHSNLSLFLSCLSSKQTILTTSKVHPSCSSPPIAMLIRASWFLSSLPSFTVLLTPTRYHSPTLNAGNHFNDPLDDANVTTVFLDSCIDSAHTSAWSASEPFFVPSSSKPLPSLLVWKPKPSTWHRSSISPEAV
ncbi:hypothetical protein BC937DRAFT_91236 [Endogone sp. FLAS-F59071]|nr:hypothetical protein BC937DRAFT_91236 [Endogone sp. FLAS-F59071]|eukprot:RUS21859.1 hypothetical protein BC937DRAFT_91236 [Endogone sp. FLAS-F59071]